MGSKRSVENVLSSLEARVAFYREQVAVHAERQTFHAQQEAHHREQQALQKAELEKALQSLETFRAVVTSAVDLPGVSPQPDETPLPPPNRKMVGRLIMLAVDSPELEEPFGPSDVAAETNRSFNDHLRKPVGPRTASDVLRRMLAAGEIELVRRGTANREALYKRGPLDES